METNMYAEMSHMEQTHWWFLGRASIILSLLQRYTTPSTLLDIGMGTGLNAKHFADLGYQVTGIEPSSEAIQFATHTAPTAKILQTAFPSPSIPSDTYKNAVMLDVLEHIEDDTSALKELHRVLAPGGNVVITVPAFTFLWTNHDDRAHHYRRYTRAQLLHLLETAGFDVPVISYYNFLLFPLIVIARLIAKLKPSEVSDFDKTPAIINPLLKSIFSFERHLLAVVSLPLGVSIVALAHKRYA